MKKTQEPSLLDWATANEDKVLPAESPIFDKSDLPEVTHMKADEVATALVTVLPPKSEVITPIIESPLAGPDDEVVQFLEGLIHEYEEWGKELDLRLAKMIVVHEDYLVIDGIKIKRKNEKMDDTTRRNAWARFDTAVFGFASASMHFWKNLPTEDEWRRIIDAIPGERDSEKRKNTAKILEIICTETVTTEPQEAFFWIQCLSQPKNSKKGPKKIGRRAIISKDPHTSHLSFKNSGDIHSVFHSVRLIVR